MCHMRVSSSVGETPKEFVYFFVIRFCFSFLIFRKITKKYSVFAGLSCSNHKKEKKLQDFFPVNPNECTWKILLHPFLHQYQLRFISDRTCSEQYPNTAPTQLSGRISSAVFTAAQIRPSASWQLDNFLRPQGAFPPGFYLLREGWVHCPAPEAPLTRGMPKGLRVFLTNSGRVWAPALRPVPPKKRPCAIHARKVGRASNTADRTCSLDLYSKRETQVSFFFIKVDGGKESPIHISGFANLQW